MEPIRLSSRDHSGQCIKLVDSIHSGGTTIVARERTYFDNAATSWPKPQSVFDAIRYHMEELGAAAGRSGYREANEVERYILDTRKQVAYLFGISAPEQVIFGHNGTDALNLAIHGLLRRGDHVVSTTLEHNSVIRPLAQLKSNLGVETTLVSPNGEGLISPDAIELALQSNTRLVVVSHASNVTGAVQPVEEIFDRVAKHGVRMLVDAAQTAGHLELNLSQTPIDMVACSGHKGLLGPLGTGLLVVQSHMSDELESIRQGGTGTVSESGQQPDQLPSKFESGNANVPGILGLRAGVEYIREQTVSALHRRTMKNTEQLVDGLRDLSKVTVFGPSDIQQRVGIVSIQVESFDPHELSAALDSAFGVQCRAGLHCTPNIHEQLGTASSGGTLRFSLGVFNTEEEVERALEAVRAIVSN